MLTSGSSTSRCVRAVDDIAEILAFLRLPRAGIAVHLVASRCEWPAGRRCRHGGGVAGLDHHGLPVDGRAVGRLGVAAAA